MSSIGDIPPEVLYQIFEYLIDRFGLLRTVHPIWRDVVDLFPLSKTICKCCIRFATPFSNSKTSSSIIFESQSLMVYFHQHYNLKTLTFKTINKGIQCGASLDTISLFPRIHINVLLCSAFEGRIDVLVKYLPDFFNSWTENDDRRKVLRIQINELILFLFFSKKSPEAVEFLKTHADAFLNFNLHPSNRHYYPSVPYLNWVGKIKLCYLEFSTDFKLELTLQRLFEILEFYASLQETSYVQFRKKILEFLRYHTLISSNISTSDLLLIEDFPELLKRNTLTHFIRQQPPTKMKEWFEKLCVSSNCRPSERSEIYYLLFNASLTLPQTSEEGLNPLLSLIPPGAIIGSSTTLLDNDSLRSLNLQDVQWYVASVKAIVNPLFSNASHFLEFLVSYLTKKKDMHHLLQHCETLYKDLPSCKINLRSIYTVDNVDHIFHHCPNLIRLNSKSVLMKQSTDYTKVFIFQQFLSLVHPDSVHKHELLYLVACSLELENKSSDIAISFVLTMNEKFYNFYKDLNVFCSVLKTIRDISRLKEKLQFRFKRLKSLYYYYMIEKREKLPLLWTFVQTHRHALFLLEQGVPFPKNRTTRNTFQTDELQTAIFLQKHGIVVRDFNDLCVQCDRLDLVSSLTTTKSGRRRKFIDGAYCNKTLKLNRQILES